MSNIVELNQARMKTKYATTEFTDCWMYLCDQPHNSIMIGLHEIEHVAGQDADQIQFQDFTDVTRKAMLKRPEHAADILLVSSWILAEALCVDHEKRDIVRQHYMVIANSTEKALSCPSKKVMC